MAIVLGLLVAITYGAGDFLGGLAAKRSATMAVVIGSFGVAAVLLGVVTVGWMAIGDPPTPTTNDLWLGVGTGLIAPFGIGLLYQGLATGRMSVVAPITAVVAASVPLAWGLFEGERPSSGALVGVAMALVAVILISGAPTPEAHRADTAALPLAAVVGPAMGSGLAFGVIFVLLGSTSADAGLWPLVVARPLAVALTVLAAAILARRAHRALGPSIVPSRSAWPYVVGAGVLDITANAFYLAGTNAGLLSIVAVLSSLYPAATVLLARIFLDERLHRLQIAGLALAALGAAAMAAA